MLAPAPPATPNDVVLGALKGFVLGAPKDVALGAPKDVVLGAPKDVVLGAPKELVLGALNELVLGAPNEVLGRCAAELPKENMKNDLFFPILNELDSVLDFHQKYQPNTHGK